MNKLKLLNVGFGNIIPVDEVIAIVSPSSAPIKRLIQKAKEERGQKDEDSGKEIGLIDLTQGRKSRAAVITDYGRVYLSSLQPETIVNRIKTNSSSSMDEDLSEEEDKAVKKSKK